MRGREVQPPAAPFWYRDDPGVWLPLSCAITAVANGTGNSGGDPSPYAFSFASGTCDLIVVGFDCATAGTTGVTFNGVAMTKTDGITVSGTDTIELWWIVGQSGTHNISIAYTGTPQHRVGAASYLGANSSQPDAHGTNSGASEATTAIPLTIANDQSWMVAMCHDTNDNTLTASTGATERAAPQSYAKLFDSNGGLSTGAQTISVAHVNGSLKSAEASFKPVGGATRGLFAVPPGIAGVGVGGSFFRDPLQGARA